MVRRFFGHCPKTRAPARYASCKSSPKNSGAESGRVLATPLHALNAMAFVWLMDADIATSIPSVCHLSWEPRSHRWPSASLALSGNVFGHNSIQKLDLDSLPRQLRLARNFHLPWGRSPRCPLGSRDSDRPAAMNSQHLKRRQPTSVSKQCGSAQVTSANLPLIAICFWRDCEWRQR